MAVPALTSFVERRHERQCGRCTEECVRHNDFNMLPALMEN